MIPVGVRRARGECLLTEPAKADRSGSALLPPPEDREQECHEQTETPPTIHSTGLTKRTEVPAPYTSVVTSTRGGEPRPEVECGEQVG